MLFQTAEVPFSVEISIAPPLSFGDKGNPCRCGPTHRGFGFAGGDIAGKYDYYGNGASLGRGSADGCPGMGRRAVVGVTPLGRKTSVDPPVTTAVPAVARFAPEEPWSP
jgi:hypothetical protein